MIYFKNHLVAIAKDLIESHDDWDTAKDLKKIENAKRNLHTISGRIYANDLNEELRKKYPNIERMLNVADCFTPFQVTNGYSPNNNVTIEEKLLTQDEYGILCDQLIKSKIINCIEDFIEMVSNN